VAGGEWPAWRLGGGDCGGGGGGGWSWGCGLGWCEVGVGLELLVRLGSGQGLRWWLGQGNAIGVAARGCACSSRAAGKRKRGTE